MLQSFREHIKGWVAGVIFVIISLTFLLWGVQYYMQARADADKVVAKVDGREIKLSVVNQQFQQYQMENGFVASKQQKLQIKQSILNDLISQAVVSQAMRVAGFVGSPGQIQQALLSSAFVMPYELKSAEESIVQHSHLGYILISLNRYLQNVTINPQDIQAYYNKNKDEFKTPEQLKLAYIEYSPSEVEKSVTISDEKAREYYLANLSNYSRPKSWTVERLVVPLDKEGSPEEKEAMQKLQSQLKKTKDFYDAVKEHSTWHLANQQITAVELQGELFNVLSGLKVGEISSPVVTREGVNVFKLLKYSPASTDSFLTVKDAIKKMLKSQEVSSRLASVNQDLSDLTYTNPESLEPASKQLNLPIKLSDWVSIGAGKGIFSDAEIRALAFSNDVLSQGNNSKVVTLKNGNSLVLRVKQREPSKLKSLSSVRAVIIENLKKQAAKKQAGSQALQIQKMLEQGVAGKKVATHFGVQWHQYNNTGKINQALLRLSLIGQYNLPAAEISQVKVKDELAPSLAILQASFQSPLGQKSSLGFTELKNGDYVITQRLPVKVGSVNASLNTQRDQTMDILGQLQASLSLQMALGSMQKSAKIKSYPELLTGAA